MKRLINIFTIFLITSNISYSQDTITIYPNKDALLIHCTNPATYDPPNTGTPYQAKNYGSSSVLRSMSWTHSGYPLKYKALIGIDLSSIPSNAIILNATLSLFNGNHINNITTGSSSYKSNASYLKRVIAPWEEHNVTWNTAPATTSYNQVILENSTTTSKNYNEDVTELIKDMLKYPTESHGLMLQLVTDSYWTKMEFASSDHSDTGLHPKLEISYIVVNNIQIGDQNNVSYSYDGPEITPFGSYYEDSRNEYLFLASELQNAGMQQGYIYSISFDVVSPSTELNNFNVHIGHTSLSEMNYSGFIEGMANVYSNTFYPVAGWNNMVFEMPFYWDGVSNIIIQTCFDNDYYTENSTVRYSTTSNNSVRGYYDDGEIGCSMDYVDFNRNGRPNIKFSVETPLSYTPPFLIGDYNRSISTSKNYIRTLTAQKPGYTSTLLNETNPYNINEQVQYFDGLGRLIQDVTVCFSPTGKDIVKPIEYDDFGRVDKEYLPYPSNLENGSYRGNGLAEQNSYYSNDEPFAKTLFENSPINRVLKQGSPGAGFQPIEGSADHAKEFQYGANDEYEVRYYSVDTNGDLQNSPSHYNPNELYKNRFKDEEGNWTEEYKDKQGRTILKRIKSNTDHSTYYVYDDFGLLRFVLSPKSGADTEKPNTTELNELCYIYKYDSRKRMIEKKLPGAATVYMVYDKRDRLVLTQDGKLRQTNQWLYTQYDILNRPVVTGIYSDNVYTSRQSMQTHVNDFNDANPLFETVESSGYGYDNASFPGSTATVKIHTVTYYDDYDFPTQSELLNLTINTSDNIDSYVDNDGASNGYFDNVKGQVTGTKVLVLDDAQTSHWVYNVNFYDDKYRVIQTQQKMYPEGNSMISTNYDFVGNVLETLEIQNVGSDENSTHLEYIYDHFDRLLETYITVNNGDKVLLSQMNYNELGELEEKNLHSSDMSLIAQSIDYKYNIRGWLTNINDPAQLSLESDKFGMELYYENTDNDVGNSAVYNGNISGVKWSRGEADIQTYNYAYDDFNRITTANYKNYNGSTWSSNAFNATYSYDLNGNLSTLTRKSSGTTIDNLIYYYKSSGNQIDYVRDLSNNSAGLYEETAGASGVYSYDENGNLDADENKMFSIAYNYLNLPKYIVGTGMTDDYISYIYDANGNKLLKEYYSEDDDITYFTMYAGQFVYDNNNGYQLDYLLHSEGKIEMTGSTLNSYEYHIKDHLGNTRVSFIAESSTGAQETDYYPFGMSFIGMQGGDNKYLYNGKELQDEAFNGRNLDWYDYGARFYDPTLGRFHTQDPLAEDYSFQSQYVYAANNPIMFIDYLGLAPGDPEKVGVLKVNRTARIVAGTPATGGIGPSFSITSTAALDLNENRAGFHLTFGGGIGIGAGAGLSVGAEYMPVGNPSDLLGAGSEVGIMGGEVAMVDLNMSTTGSPFNTEESKKTGGGANVGIGAGAAIYGESQYTVGFEGDYVDLGISFLGKAIGSSFASSIAISVRSIFSSDNNTDSNTETVTGTQDAIQTYEFPTTEIDNTKVPKHYYYE